MLTTDDVKIIKEIVHEVVGDAVAPLVTKDEAKGFATKDDLKLLATKDDLAKLDTKITRLDVKMSGQFSELKDKTTKDAKKLERAIKTEHRIGNNDFGHLEKEDRKIVVRVDRIEHHLGFVTAS